MDAIANTLTDDPATLSRADPAPPSTMVIFGAGGDLTKRLLMPALYNMTVAGLLPDQFSIIAVDHVESSDEAYRQSQTETMQSFVADKSGESHIDALDAKSWGWLRDRLSYMQGDFEQPATYKKIGERLEAMRGEKGHGNCVFYLAVADRFFATIIDQLGAGMLTSQDGGDFRRVVIEKPFGHDLQSARELNAHVLRVLEEDQIYRIDHFLGKETVQNIMALRFANGIFEPLWNRDHIDHVQITAAETVGVESRGRFYEPTGALRDMVPNHMFQLMAMIAMEPPNSFDANDVRTEKAKAIQAIQPVALADVADYAVRGQYTAGEVGGTDRIGYRAEQNVSPNSQTETYVALKFRIENWRWAGVPFYVRTGKRMGKRKTEIVVHFKQAPYALFRDTPVEKLAPNIMTIHIQPSEGLTLQFSAKVPGPVVHLGAVHMDFRYEDYFKAENSTGYETLLYDVLIGDSTLFQRADNVEAGWAAVQPMLDAWGKGLGTVEGYAAGSSGPLAADEMMARDGRRWATL